MEMSRGTITSMRVEGDYTVDLIPVDVVCNTMITAAWANSFTRSNTVPVYNCTSGQLNPINWTDLGDKIIKYSRKNPTKYVMLYPGYSYIINPFLHRLVEVFLHFLPAIIFDFMLKAQGKKTFMFKLAKRFKVASDTGSYFALHEWNFDTRNFRRLMRVARETQLDADEFNFDMSNMDWDSYVENYMMGIRTFVLKDDTSSLPKARRKLQRILWTKRIFQVILIIGVYFVLFNGLWK